MLLNLKNISVGYQKPLISDFSAEVQEGDLVLILGRNGVGKSTLLGALKNTLRPLAGELTLQGKPLANFSIQELSQTMAVVNTTRPDLTGWKVMDVLENTQKSRGIQDEAALSEVLKLCRIENLAHKFCHQLSDGEFQKVMIARAIAQKTPLIIMDEPTSFLDVIYREQVLQIFKELKSAFGTTVILSSHNFAPLLSEAAQVWLLNNGKVNVLTENLEEQRIVELMKS